MGCKGLSGSLGPIACFQADQAEMIPGKHWVFSTLNSSPPSSPPPIPFSVFSSPFLHFSLPPLPFFSPKHRILRKYHEQQRRDKIEVNPLKCLFTSCLTFDGSRNITDTKRIETLGPWETESQRWKSLQGKHQIAISSCFKLYKQAESELYDFANNSTPKPMAHTFLRLSLQSISLLLPSACAISLINLRKVFSFMNAVQKKTDIIKGDKGRFWNLNSWWS